MEETREQVAAGEFMLDLSWVRDPRAAEELARNPGPFCAGRGLFFKGFVLVLRRFAACVAVYIACEANCGGFCTSACSSGGNECTQRGEPENAISTQSFQLR